MQTSFHERPWRTARGGVGSPRTSEDLWACMRVVVAESQASCCITMDDDGFGGRVCRVLCALISLDAPIGKTLKWEG